MAGTFDEDALDATQHLDDDAFDEAGESLSLIVIGGGGGATHTLPAAGAVRIGRAEDAEVRIKDASISRYHATLRLGPPLELEDLGSQNGTRLGGARLRPRKPVPLSPGDVIQLGAATAVLANRRLVLRPGPLWAEVAASRPASGKRATRDPLVIADETMQRLHGLLERIAKAGIPVLLLGETGVGKEIFAERLHALSPRAARPLLRLNCAALAEPLLESELFGHERGAFTGAHQTKVGLLEGATGGTVFLDEIGDLPPSSQVKLLRVIEDKEVMRVGGGRPRPIDVRFVAATNRDLEREATRGIFRQDLYFRLAGFSLVIPALRDRPEEIEPLARLFIHRACVAAGAAREPDLTADAIAALRGHAWPGNVRQLRNVMERAVLLLSSAGPITPQAMGLETPSEPRSPASSHAPSPASGEARGVRAEVDELERSRILETLDRCGSNQSRAAELLGIPRRTLLRRLDAYGIARPRKKLE